MAITGVALTWLGLSVLHSLVLLAVARACAWLASLAPVRAAVATAPGDDVHALLALNMVAEVGEGRLALLTDPRQDAGAYLLKLPFSSVLGAVFPEGTPLVGIHIAFVLTNLAILLAGLLVLHLARSRRQALPGMVAAAFAAGMQLFVSWEPGTGGGIALSMVATKIFEMDGPTWEAFSSGMILSVLLNAGVLSVAGGSVFALWWVVKRPRVVSRRVLMRPAASVLGVALLLQTPLGPSVSVERPVRPESDLYVSSLAEPAAAGPAPAVPSRVSVERGPNGWEYRVNGEIRRIRCIGYNVMTDQMGRAEKAARYAEDFSTLRAARVNTILGWDQEMFDGVLLAEAARHRLGVIPHFELDAAWDYTKPELVQRKLSELRSWVRHLRDSPAIRMWGIGNEVIHKYADNSDPRSAAFARFLIRAADLVHQEDPHHPVIYRDAEDVFIEPVEKALRADGVMRPWLVYGMNFFSYRMDTALAQGPSARLGQPLLISEFAPLGLGPDDRPTGYLKLWEMVRGHRNRVLGGCAYVWTTAGPEPVDRNLGLTDGTGSPVDGSFPVLAGAFRREAADLEFARSLSAP